MRDETWPSIRWTITLANAKNSSTSELDGSKCRFLCRWPPSATAPPRTRTRRLCQFESTYTAYYLWPPCVADADILFYRCGHCLSSFFMATLWNRAPLYFSLWFLLVHGQVTIIFVFSVCLFVCLCRVFLSRLWSDFDQTRTHVICLGLVVSPRI